jgi:hypothetical protein
VAQRPYQRTTRSFLYYRAIEVMESVSLCGDLVMEADRIDIDLLIDEIEKRPAIWNFESPHYKNRVLKNSNKSSIDLIDILK